MLLFLLLLLLLLLLFVAVGCCAAVLSVVVRGHTDVFGMLPSSDKEQFITTLWPFISNRHEPAMDELVDRAIPFKKKREAFLMGLRKLP
jgi:hypothetical protein